MSPDNKQIHIFQLKPLFAHIVINNRGHLHSLALGTTVTFKQPWPWVSGQC